MYININLITTCKQKIAHYSTHIHTHADMEYWQFIYIYIYIYIYININLIITCKQRIAHVQDGDVHTHGDRAYTAAHTYIQAHVAYLLHT
jgi:hypothetical protein